MRLIDADVLIPMMKYATTDSEIGVFDDGPIRDRCFRLICEWLKSEAKAKK